MTPEEIGKEIEVRIRAEIERQVRIQLNQPYWTKHIKSKVKEYINAEVEKQANARLAALKENE